MPGKRVQIDQETLTALESLAEDRMMTFQEVTDEAFACLLKKYNRPADLKSALRESAKDSTEETPKHSAKKRVRHSAKNGAKRSAKNSAENSPKNPAKNAAKNPAENSAKIIPLNGKRRRRAPRNDR
jgi:hypothetical protein